MKIICNLLKHFHLLLVFGPIDIANLWNPFNRIRIIMGEFGCTQIRTSSSYSFERKKDFGNLFYHKIYHSTIFSLDVCSGPMWPKKCMMWDFIFLLVTQSSTSAIFYFHCSCHCRLLSLSLHCAVYGLKEETTGKLENMHCIALHCIGQIIFANVEPQ